MCQRRRGGRCIQSIVLAINIDGQITATEHHTLNSVPRKKSTKLEQIQASELSNYWTESTRILYLEGVGFSLGKSPLQLAVLVPLSEATTEGEDAWIPPVLASAAATSATTAVAPQSYRNSISSSSSTAVFPRPGEGVVAIWRSSRRQAGGGRRPAEGGGGLSRCDV